MRFIRKWTRDAYREGGPGSSAVTSAIASLGITGMGTMDPSNVTITGGSITGITDLAVADGGTGASDATNARSNLGLGGAAVLNVGTTAGTVAAGDDARFGAAPPAHAASHMTGADKLQLSAGDKILGRVSGAGDIQEIDCTTAGRALLDDANNTAQRSTLGLVIGTDVQAYDAQLADVAGLAVTDGNFIVGNGANFVAESGETARASLGLELIANRLTCTYCTEMLALCSAVKLGIVMDQWYLVSVSSPDDNYRTYDVSLNANHLNFATALGWDPATDKVAQGWLWTAQPDGSTQYGWIADAATLTFGNGTTDSAFTLSLWFYCTGATLKALFVKGGSSAATREYAVRVDGSGYLGLRLYDASTSGYIGRRTNAAPSAGWHNVTFTYSGAGVGSGIIIYLDGSAVAISNDSSGSYTAMEDLAQNVGVFGDNAGGSLYGGAFGSIFIDGSVWSAMTVWKAYLAGLGLYNLQGSA